jgi:hypothetical protein
LPHSPLISPDSFRSARQALQLASHEEEQQTLSTQNVLRHSLPCAQVVPASFLHAPVPSHTLPFEQAP